MSLEAENIKKREIKGCCVSKYYTLAYTLPISLDSSILPHIISIGIPSMSFEKTSLLMIENEDLVITGIKKFKEIKFSLKNKEKTNLIEEFEKGLINYVKGSR